jgi:hypothetical protein
MVSRSEIDPRFKRILHDLRARYQELKDLHDEVVHRANRLSYLGAAARVSLIILGAVGTAKAVATEALGSNSNIDELTFAAIGILTATIAGLETAFKWERKSGELTSLATVCAATMHTMKDAWSQLMLDYSKYDSDWLSHVEKQAKKDFAVLDNKLVEIYTRGARLGVKQIVASEMKLTPEEMFESPVDSPSARFAHTNTTVKAPSQVKSERPDPL